MCIVWRVSGAAAPSCDFRASSLWQTKTYYAYATEGQARQTNKKKAATKQGHGGGMEWGDTARDREPDMKIYGGQNIYSRRYKMSYKRTTRKTKKDASGPKQRLVKYFFLKSI